MLKYVKKINNKIEIAPKTYIDENGNTFINYNKNYDKLEEDGWLATERPIGTFDIIDNEIIDLVQQSYNETPIIHRYSKYKLKLELQKVGLWDSVKALLTTDPDLWENFNFANELSEEDEFFNNFITSARENTVFALYIDQVLLASEIF